MGPVPTLPLGRFRAAFASCGPVRVMDFPGNVWRGALGHALRRTVCVTREQRCRDCSLYRSCLFPWFWDTPPPPGSAKMRKYETAPHPFVLMADPARPLSLEFVLIGHANRHLALFLHALAQAAAGPRGVAGNRLSLLSVEQQLPDGGRSQIYAEGATGGPRTAPWRTVFTPGGTLAPLPVATPTIPAVPDSCVIEIHTPLRVKREGRHVGPGAFAFADLFGNLLRRISMLTLFHTDTPLTTDFKALKDAARSVAICANLKWQDQRRYSRRQEAELRMGGVVGRIVIDGVDLAPFWPYLWLGQYVHAGGGATMGLGRYAIDASLQGTTEA